MTSIDGPVLGSHLHPSARLVHQVDDVEAPTELTVYSLDASDLTTHWLTVNIDGAVPIERMR